MVEDILFCVDSPIGPTYATIRVLNTNTGLTDDTFYYMGQHFWSSKDLINIDNGVITVKGIEITIADTAVSPKLMEVQEEKHKSYLRSMIFDMEEQKEIEVNIAEYCVTQGADFKFWSDFLTDEQIIRWSQADSSSDFSVVDYIKILNNDPPAADKLLGNLRNLFYSALLDA